MGPVPWSFLCRSLRALGWRWWLQEEEDTDPGGSFSTFPFTFRRGWLLFEPCEGASFPAARVERLALELATAGGRAIVVRTEDALLRPRKGAVGAEVSVTDRTFGPDGGVATHRTDAPDDAYDLDADWISDGSALAIALDVWDEVPLPAPVALPDGPHPELDPRAGYLRLPAQDPPAVVRGPSLALDAGGHPVAVDPAGRAALEAALARADALDEETRAPDLERWRERAARRLGLSAPPAPDSAERAAWERTVAELTERDRAAPGRGGRVAAFKLRTPGTWVLSEAELARVASAAGVPEALRLVAARGDRCEVAVAASSAPAVTPWTLR